MAERTPEGTQLDFKQVHYAPGQDFATGVWKCDALSVAQAAASRSHLAMVC